MQALHGHRHGHTHPATPSTEGRLIRYAWIYDPIVWLMALGQTRALRALPLDLAAIRPGERVLDVGCGTGALTLAAARRTGPNGMVFGIDASPEMIAVARRKARRAGRSVRFQVEAVEAMSFPEASFDVVLSSLMMHHLPGDLKQHALLEICRVLRPGGRVVIVDLEMQAGAKLPRFWQPGWLAVRRHKMHHKPHEPHTASATPTGAGATGLSALAHLLRETGFTGVESGPTRYTWIGYTLGYAPA